MDAIEADSPPAAEAHWLLAPLLLLLLPSAPAEPVAACRLLISFKAGSAEVAAGVEEEEEEEVIASIGIEEGRASPA